MRRLGNSVRQFIRGYSERTTSPSISAGALTLDLAQAQTFLVSKNGNMTTLTISNIPRAGVVHFSIKITANGSSYTWTWPASVKWAGGTAPTLTNTSGKRDWISLVSDDQGTTWFGFVNGQNY